MTGRLEGKVALITGAARGQGRSHAIRFAEEGADIIAVDICEQIDNVPYPLATPDDLAQTARLVEEVGRSCVSIQADTRERSQLRDAVDEGLDRLGHLDILVANAGILPSGLDKGVDAFNDAVDVDLVGVINAVSVCTAALPDGGAIVITGSTAGLTPGAVSNPQIGPGGQGYGFAKLTLVTYTEALALQFAPRMIRVNAVHPTNTSTHLLFHDDLYRVFRPDLEKPTREDAELSFPAFHAMPVPYVEPSDITNAVLFLASDEARYVTGIQLRVDAGSMVKNVGPGQ